MFGKTYEDRKDYLAETASAIFFRKGFKESSLHDVALKANISKAGVYHYFKTKEDMLSYILLKNTQLGIEELTICIENNKSKNYDPKKSFIQVIYAYANYLMKNKSHRMLVLRERHQLTGKNKQALKKMERNIFMLLRNELKRVPDVNKKYNENVISFLIISMLHWMGYWFNTKNKLRLEEVIGQNIDIIFHGMLKR